MPPEKDYSILDSLFPTHLIVDTFPHAVFLKNEELRFVFVNRAYETMFKTALEDVLGKTVLELPFLSEQDRKNFHNEDRELLLHQQTTQHIKRFQLSDGEMHTYLFWSKGFIHENGSRGLMGVIVDITDQSRTIAMLHKKLRRMTSKTREFEKQSIIDYLTGIHNRRFFDALLRQHAISAVRDESCFSCILIDVDHFKKVNDTFGHLAGDDVLKNIAQCLKDCSRYGDILCRYGGDEFALLLPGCREDEAVSIAERIRLCVQQTIPLPDQTHVTISAGCSEYIAGEEESCVVQRADEALYAVKQTGRNRVCSSQRNDCSSAGPDSL